ncbi:MAG: DUF3108 domain-containing protein [Verrucomicrobiota bacterium]
MQSRTRSLPDPRPALFHALRVLAVGFFFVALHHGLRADEDREATDDDRPFTAEDLTAVQRASLITPAPDRPLRFEPGEVLVYKIGWSFFEVGEARVSIVADTFEGAPAWRMQMTARTNAFADAFYKVRNTTRAWLSPDLSRTLHYEGVQNEGKRHRETVLHFSPDGTRVAYEDLREESRRAPIAIIPGTWDPMGITYFVRSLALEDGAQLVIPTTNGKELFLTEVEVVKRERRRFKSGRQHAILLEPNIKDLGGVFRKSDDASVRFWFSDDERQLPLRMESSVAVGKFWAELVEIERTAPDTPAEDGALTASGDAE